MLPALCLAKVECCRAAGVETVLGVSLVLFITRQGASQVDDLLHLDFRFLAPRSDWLW